MGVAFDWLMVENKCVVITDQLVCIILCIIYRLYCTSCLNGLLKLINRLTYNIVSHPPVGVVLVLIDEWGGAGSGLQDERGGTGGGRIGGVGVGAGAAASLR